MFRWSRPLALAMGLAALGFGCNTGISTPTAVAVPTAGVVTAVTVTGGALAVGQSAQFTATATLGDGSTRDITPVAMWLSTNTQAAVVSTTGTVTALGPGDLVIMASYNNITASYPVTVTP